MERPERERIVEELARAFGAAIDVTPAPGQPLHVVLSTRSNSQLRGVPRPTRALTTWADWPTAKAAVLHRRGRGGRIRHPPPQPQHGLPARRALDSVQLHVPRSGQDPVRAVQYWMTRFVKERS